MNARAVSGLVATWSVLFMASATSAQKPSPAAARTYVSVKDQGSPNSVSGGLSSPADGSIDSSFNVGGVGPNSDVLAVAMQPDGRIVIGGFFTRYNGDFAASDYVMRLNADGTRDTTFNPGGAGADTTVYAVAVQPDGKILIAGQFTSYNGDAAASDYVMRLNADGTRDTTFNAGGSGANDYVWGFALQPDGKILVAGNFFTYNGNPTSGRVMRLNTDGTRDTTFNANGSGAQGTASAVAVQPDGKIVIAGLFTSYNGDAAASDYVMRLNADGTRDTSFNPVGTGADAWVHALAIQPDGKIVIGGNFTRYNGDAAASDYVMRLNADGTRDTTFDAGGTGADATVNAIAMQPDGKIIIGGLFTGYNGDVGASNYLIRLTTDGKPDTTFNPGGTGANALVYGLAVQPDGRIVIGGQFTAYNGDFAAPDYVMRLSSTPPPTPVCSSVPGGIISWWPGGGNAQDIVGHYDGALQNGATFGMGMVGQAFSLDGVDDAIVINDTAALNPASITVEAWIKPSSLPAGALADVVTKWGFDATVDSYFLGLLNSGGVVRVLGGIGDGATGDSGFSGGTVTLSTWNHIAMTYDAATGLNRLYLNGVSVSQRVRANGIYRTTSRVFIGREDSNNNRFFSGLIDEPTIYSRALTGAEIVAIYNAGGSGKCGAVPPTAVDDGPYAISEDSPLIVSAPGVLANDTAGDGGPLTAIKLSSPAHGSVTVNADGSFTYAPEADYNGPDSFTYKANNGTADSNVATVTIGIQPSPDAPVAKAGPDQTSSTGFVQLDGSASFDPDGDAISFEWFEGATPLGGGPTLAINLGEGQHTITLAVTDSTGRSGTDTVLVTVTIVQIRSVTALSLVASPNPATVGRDVTLTATVSSPGGTPAGEVLFTLRRGSRVFPLALPVPLNASGVATLLIPASALAAVGSASLDAQYAGNDSYLPSQNSTILDIVKATTQTTLTATVNPSLTTAPPVFIAEVSAASSVQPTGKVEFFADGSLLCRSTVFSRGLQRIASCGGAPLPVGDHAVTATYTGDQNFLASEVASLTQTVRQGTYRTIDLGFDGEAVAISPNGYIAGNSPITLSGATAYVYDGAPHPILSLAGTLTGSQAVGVDEAGRVGGSSRTTDGAVHAFMFVQTATVDRGTLGGSSSLANAMNRSGTIVGAAQTVTGAMHAFADGRGGLVDLGTLGGAASVARAISENSNIAGVAALADGTTHAALFGTQAPPVDLGTLGGATSVAAAVNSAAEVAGTSDVSNPSFTHAFIWRPDGGLEDLGTLLGPGSTRAAGVNDAGQVAGIDDTTDFSDPRAGVRRLHAFLYANGSLRNLGEVSKTGGFVSGISNAGMVIGGSDPLAFASNGVAMTDLATLGGARSAALAINDAGQIVGWSENAAGIHRATLWAPVGPATLVVDPASGQADGVVSLRARLTSFGEAATGKTITFSLNGHDVATAVTDNSGVATASGVSLLRIPVATYPNGVGARFAGDLNLVPAAGDAALTVRPNPPDLVAFKSIVTPTGALTQATANIGDLVTFRLVASNLERLGGGVGPTVGPTILTDVLPSALTFVSAGSDARCSAAGQTVSCSESRRLAVGEGVSFDIVARVNPIDGAGTRVPVVNTVRATTDGDSDFGDDSASATLTVLVPDVSLSMQVRNFNGGTFASSVDIQNGAQLEIRWTLAVSTTSAAGVDISDVLPAGLTFVRTTAGPPGLGNFCSGGSQVVACHVSGLTPGIGATFSFVVAVNANLGGIGPFVTLMNTARVSNTIDADPSNNAASITVNVARPDISLSMTVTGGSGIVVNQGAELNIDVYVSSSLPGTGTIFLSNAFPAGLTRLGTSTSGGASCLGSSCQLSFSQARRSWRVTFRVRVSADLAGAGPFVTLTNTARVSGADADPSNNSASITVNVRRPDISVRMTVSGGSSILVDEGAELDIDIYVSASSTAGAGTISLYDSLPSGLRFVRGTGAYSSRCTGNGWIRCTLPTSSSGGANNWRVSFRVRVSADLAGTGPFVTLTNTAIAGGSVDGDRSNNAASITVNVRRPDVSLFMGVREPSGNGAFGLSVTAARGAALEIEWRVAISKAGIVPITVTDTLPAGLTFTRTTSVQGGSQCGSQGQVVTCQITSSSGSFWIFRFLVAVSDQLVVPDTLINTAEVSAFSDADPSNNSASVTVNVVRR